MHKINIDGNDFVFRNKEEYYSMASRYKSNASAIHHYFFEIGSVCGGKCIINNNTHIIENIGIFVSMGKFHPFMVQIENGDVYSSYDVNIKHSSGAIIPIRSYLRAVGKGYLK